MNAAAHRVEDNPNAPVLYLAPELSNTTWKVVFGDAARRPASGGARARQDADARAGQHVGEQLLTAVQHRLPGRQVGEHALRAGAHRYDSACGDQIRTPSR